MRKSRELRLSQTLSLKNAYEHASLTCDYRHRFISDMYHRLEKEKALSKKQRDWLDNLIDEGVPEPKGDPIIIQKIHDAIELDGMQHRGQVLQSFLGTISRGYELSDKQAKFLDILLNEANVIKTSGRWRPSNIQELTTAILLLANKGDWYWAHRQGTSKAYHKVQLWLDWNLRRETINEIKATGKECGLTLQEEPHIDDWVCNKLIKAAKTGLSALSSPKHAIGSLCYVKYDDQSHPGMVTSSPYIKGSIVSQDILLRGNVTSYPVSSIRKRR